MDFLLRQEEKADYDEVAILTSEAFLNAEYADGTEAELVNRLRSSKAFIPSLSLVAELNGSIIGHILLTKAEVNKKEILALAPLSVKPQYWKKGVGKKLMWAAHERAKRLGYRYIVIVGHEKYYTKFGYKPAEENFGIISPIPVPKECFMAIDLLGGEKEDISGKLKYAPEFMI